MRYLTLQVLLGLTCFVLLGCRSVADFKAKDLPDTLRADAASSARRTDLSALARSNLDTDGIYPGDVLEVTLATGLEEREPQTWPLRVADDGQVEVPLVGIVRVAGLTLTDAEQAIREASVEREIFRQPHVAVLMKQRRMMRVRVVGAVENPGVHEIPAAGGDLLAALVAAGGLNEKAGTEIEIRHPNGRSLVSSDRPMGSVMLASFEESAERPARMIHLDLAEVGSEPPAEIDLHVEDGTVVVVQERAKRSVSVIGLVQKPDSYPLPEDAPLRMLDALALAGGPRVSIADRVLVIRQDPEQRDPVTIAASIRRAKQNGQENLVLQPGDVVEVEETPGTFVVESIRGFIRFGFTSAVPGL